jgi:integrase
MPLTQKFVQTHTEPGRYADKNGLMLCISPRGSKSWICRYQLNKVRRDAGLGVYPAVSLANARAKCLELKLKLANGIDPLEEKRRNVRANITFKDEAMAMIERYRLGWSEKHTSQWENSLRDHVYPFIGSVPIADVDTDKIVELLDPIWREMPESARRIRNRIERILDFSKTCGHREGENPARWAGHLQNKMTRDKPDSTPLESMPYSRLPNFMEKIEGEISRAARCLQFVILTACRSTEAMGAEWDEIDFETRTWVIPAVRMKGRVEHHVPLSDAAMQVLKDVHTRGRSKLIFPGRDLEKMMPNNAMRRVLIKHGESATPHGFRSTFRMWAAEKTKFPNDLCEIAIAHVVGTATSRAYNRGNMLELRRPLMERWAKYATSQSIAPRSLDDRVRASAPREHVMHGHA